MGSKRSSASTPFSTVAPSFAAFFRDEAVEIKSRNGVAVVGKFRVLGPVHFKRRAKAKGPKPVVLMAVRGHHVFEPICANW